MAGLLARGSQPVRTFPAFEKPVACRERTLRLQLRGQPRFWPLMGNPPRFPFSAALRIIPVAAPSISSVSRNDHPDNCNFGDFPLVPFCSETPPADRSASLE